MEEQSSRFKQLPMTVKAIHRITAIYVVQNKPIKIIRKPSRSILFKEVRNADRF